MGGNIYESEKLVSEYLLFHYGEPEQILGWEFGPREALNFPARVVGHFSPGEVGRALDLGCAVGRSTYELTRHAGEVLGVDYSQAFVEAAAAIGRSGVVAVRRLEEASLQTELVLRLPAGVLAERVQFEQGDAMALRPELGSFDRVLAANLLCRLTDPARLLIRLPELVCPGGELVLTTPCTWLAEFTPPENWPRAGTFEWLRDALGRDFELMTQQDEPFLIRETARKFQWTVALMTKWRRRS